MEGVGVDLMVGMPQLAYIIVGSELKSVVRTQLEHVDWGTSDLFPTCEDREENQLE